MLARVSILALFALSAASAQGPDDLLKSKAEAMRYPPLAAAARVYGDVQVTVADGNASLISGYPLLAQAALVNARMLAADAGHENLDIVYHFVFVDTGTMGWVSTTAQRSNALGRTFLRLLGFSTQKVVRRYQCQDGPPPPTTAKVDGNAIEVWVNEIARCI